MAIWVLRDDRFLAHDPGAGHPERPDRLRAVHAWLDETNPAGIQVREAVAADDAALLGAHTEAHVAQVAATEGRHVWLDPDTHASPRSYEAARLAAGAVCEAVDATLAGRAGGAFALVRPPGHHAESNAAMGFCLFNNVAVAAAAALARGAVRRVLVLDPDVHHGNGTQEIFWGRRDVLYVSTHRHPFYPGTGGFDEVGAGDGAGFTVNIPVPPGLGDADLVHLYRAGVEPLVEAYEPELIVVSAGFDTYVRDPLGGMRVTAEGYRALFALYRAWADRHCPGRLVFALEGGYDLEGMVVGVAAGLEALSESPPEVAELGPPSTIALDAVERMRAVHRGYSLS